MFKNRKIERITNALKERGGVERMLDFNRELLEHTIRHTPKPILKNNPQMLSWFESNERYILNIAEAAGINIDFTRIREVPDINPPQTFNIVKVVAQTTMDKSSLIRQLEAAISFLKQGHSKGIDHDDDIGFTFETTIEENSIFGNEGAATRFE